MKEFINKLIGRLEEEHERCINRYGVVGGNLPATEVKQCMEIVNELAEEYNNTSTDKSSGYCEWEYDEFEEGWQTDCGVIFTLHDSDKEITHFCPYCGKEIKAVE